MNEKYKQKTAELKRLLETNRVDILFILFSNNTCVCQMVKNLGLKHNLISHHLKTLQDMGYVSSKRNGTHIIYELTAEKRKNVGKILNFIKN